MAERKIKIRIEPAGRTVRVSKGCSALEAVWAAGLQLQSLCGGKGTCGKCRVKVRGERRLRGGVSPPDESEKSFLSPSEIRGGVRLGCRAKLTGAATIEIPAASLEYRGGLTVSAGGGGREMKISPRTRKIPLSIKPPSLRDQRSDERRLREAIGVDIEIPLDVLKRLPAVLRENNFRVDAVLCGGRLVDVCPRGRINPVGAAVDVGTTTLSVRVYDLATGKLLGEERALNPQARHGADVATRIMHAAENGVGGLREIVVDKLSYMIHDVLFKNQRWQQDVCEVVAVGNPTMMHLMLGVDPARIAPAPFIPAFTGGLDINANEAGFRVHPNAKLRVLPAVSAYIGADAVAAALAAGLTRPGAPCLLADVGTNAEIILRTPGGITACSAAAGPAFEGASLDCGTWAREGAVQHVNLAPGLEYSTIGGAPPAGLCGSAVIDLVAELRRSGALQPGGRLAPDELFAEYKPLNKHFRIVDGQPRFVLNPGAKKPVYLSQRDARQVQLAKGAIRTGAYFLMKRLKVGASDLKRVYLAGLLGSSLRPESVLAAGMLPPVAPSAISYLGNAAIEGAAMVLLQERRWSEAARLAGSIDYVELSGLKGFQERFTEFLRFP